MLVLLIIFSYLIGSISFAILICKMLGAKDPRLAGSNNPGTTNVRRIAGNKAAIAVLLAEIMKGFVPTFIAYTLDLTLFEVSLVGLAAILGHLYPLFFRFKGGKGVATYIGVLLAYQPIVAFIFIIVWLFIAKILKISSISALIATSITVISYYFFNKDIASNIVILIICLLIFYSHRENIKRMIYKKEV